MKYLFPLILWCIAAFFTGELLALSGTQATFDAWILTLTVVGHDVGDRMALAGRMIFSSAPLETITGVGYILGQALLEEGVKFIAFIIALRTIKPATIYQIILMGIVVGVGFAWVENFAFHEFLTPTQSIVTFILRALWHSFFTAMIALLYALGYFSQLRWIDAGARGRFHAWLVRYSEFGIASLFTGLGLIFSSLLHAVTDIMIAFGGQMIVVPFMVIGWCAFVLFLQTPGARRPYGALLQKFELMQTIREANQELSQIQSLSRQRKPHSHRVFVKKALSHRKQFAKT